MVGLSPLGDGFQGSGVAYPTGTGPIASIPMVPGEAQEPLSHHSLHSTGPLKGRRGGAGNGIWTVRSSFSLLQGQKG